MGQQDRTMADTNDISIAETDAGNARMMIARAGFGGVAAANIRGTFSAHELQFFCQVDWSTRWAGKIAKV